MNKEEPMVQVEWRITTMLPRSIFEDDVNYNNNTYHKSVADFLTEKSFKYFIYDDTFDHIESEIVEIIIHE